MVKHEVFMHKPVVVQFVEVFGIFSFWLNVCLVQQLQSLSICRHDSVKASMRTQYESLMSHKFTSVNCRDIRITEWYCTECLIKKQLAARGVFNWRLKNTNFSSERWYGNLQPGQIVTAWSTGASAASTAELCNVARWKLLKIMRTFAKHSCEKETQTAETKALKHQNLVIRGITKKVIELGRIRLCCNVLSLFCPHPSHSPN